MPPQPALRKTILALTVNEFYPHACCIACENGRCFNGLLADGTPGRAGEIMVGEKVEENTISPLRFVSAQTIEECNLDEKNSPIDLEQISRRVETDLAEADKTFYAFTQAYSAQLLKMLAKPAETGLPQNGSKSQEKGKVSENFVKNSLEGLPWVVNAEIMAQNSEADTSGIDLVVTVAPEVAELLNSETFCVQVKPNNKQVRHFYTYQDKKLLEAVSHHQVRPDQPHPWETNRLVIAITKEGAREATTTLHDIILQLHQHAFWQHRLLPQKELALFNSKVSNRIPLDEAMRGQALTPVLAELFKKIQAWERNPDDYIVRLVEKANQEPSSEELKRSNSPFRSRKVDNAPRISKKAVNSTKKEKGDQRGGQKYRSARQQYHNGY